MLRTDTPNIVFVLPDGLTLGGVTTLALRVATLLETMGRSPIILSHITGRGNGRSPLMLPPTVENTDCRSTIRPGDPFLEPEDLAQYLATYEKVLPCVIMPNYWHGTFATCASIATTHPQQIRVIGFAHSDGEEYYRWLSYYEPCIHYFVGVSSEITAALSRRIPHRTADIHLLTNPVSVRPGLDRTYSTKAEPIQIVYAGRLVQHQKRVFDLVSLAEALMKKNVNFELNIIGEGAQQQTLRRKISRLHRACQNRIHMHPGKQPSEMPEIWRQSDICVLVSDYEGTSLSMLEAMAHGCVPVVTKVSGTGLLRSGVNGFCTPISDVDGMAEVIRRLSRDRSKLAQVGREAQQIVTQVTPYETYVQKLLNLIDRSWQEEPRPWPPDRKVLEPVSATEALEFTLTSMGSFQAALFRWLINILPKPILRTLYRTAYSMRSVVLDLRKVR